MPFHPKIEFALNRIGILGSIAADEMNIIFDENFGNMLRVSMDSITHPEKFQKSLRKERAAEIRKRQEHQELVQDQNERELISFSVHDFDNLQKQQRSTHNDDDEDDEENDEDPQPENQEDFEGTSESKIEKESKRIRTELQQMSLVLLDSLRLSIEVVNKKKNDKQKQEQEEEREIEEQEPDVRLSNVPLVRFVLTILSDTHTANTLRIALLQGDIPLLARAIFRSLLLLSPTTTTTTATTAGNVYSHQQQLERNHLIFLLLDTIATMCADSAACRLAFSCCIPQIAQILKTYVKPQQQLQQTKITSGKAPPLFVRPGMTSNSNEAEQKLNHHQQSNNNASNISDPTTTDDDVIFAGSAALETMLFHCSESVESLVLENDGIFILVALFRQQAQNSEKNSSTSTNNNNKDSNPAETVAFIKRTLFHIRTCGAFSQEKWEKEIFNAENILRIFGKQGDSLPVDELKWNLTGGIKAFMRK